MKVEQAKSASEIRNQLVNIALSDILNASRTNDAIREALMASLVKKSESMEALEILSAIKEIGAISSIEKTEKILSLIDNN